MLRRTLDCLFLALQVEPEKSYWCVCEFVLFFSFLKLIENPHPSVLKSCLPVLPVSQLCILHLTVLYPGLSITLSLFSPISSSVAYFLYAMNSFAFLNFEPKTTFPALCQKAFPAHSQKGRVLASNHSFQICILEMLFLAFLSFSSCVHRIM